MDFQSIVDGMEAAACIVSVENLGDGKYGKMRIVTGNRKYIDTIECPPQDLQMLTKKFVPNSEYTNYLTRDLNFESYCYRSAVQKKCLHAYAHPDRYDVWFNMSFLPVCSESEDLCHCMYVMEVNVKPDAKRLSNISADTASAVLETCIKLRSSDNFQFTMNNICEDIRNMCDSEHCCILLMDRQKQECSVLCEAFSAESELLPMEKYLDDNFYSIAESWKSTISGSNCLIVKNDSEMEVVRERNPVWHNSLTSAGAKSIVLFPLEFKKELLGYIWAINFRADNAEKIKETLELTTFILASEIYSFKLIERLHVLSSKDMLTGVMNRNEMNNYVDELVRKSSEKSAGVIFVDLNGLKKVNDEEGHTAGDNLLRDAASALKELFSVREIFRAGGDEFVVILTDITAEELHFKAEKLREISVKYKNLVFAIGEGFEENSADIRSALRTADGRMYEDKKNYYILNPDKKYR